MKPTFYVEPVIPIWRDVRLDLYTALEMYVNNELIVGTLPQPPLPPPSLMLLLLLLTDRRQLHGRIDCIYAFKSPLLSL